MEKLTIEQKFNLALEKAKRPARLAEALNVSRQFIHQVIKDERPWPIDREAELDKYLNPGQEGKDEKTDKGVFA